MLIGKIEESAPKMDSLGEGVRVLPIRGKAAERLLQQIDILRKASKSESTSKCHRIVSSVHQTRRRGACGAAQQTDDTSGTSIAGTVHSLSLPEGAQPNDPPKIRMSFPQVRVRSL